MHWPRIRGLAASAGVRLRAKETEISAAPWALRLGKGLTTKALLCSCTVTMLMAFGSVLPFFGDIAYKRSRLLLYSKLSVRP